MVVAEPAARLSRTNEIGKSAQYDGKRPYSFHMVTSISLRHLRLWWSRGVRQYPRLPRWQRWAERQATKGSRGRGFEAGRGRFRS